jgi:Predicted membrane protein (DUF2157)
MGSQILNRIAQWQAAGLVDAATAERIRAWESEHAPARSTRLGQIAFALGGVLLGAGVLLFVAANWALLAPSARFAALAATVAVLHVAGGLVRSRSVALSTTLHAVGTAALGGGIFLAGQSFNLAEQWPAGFLLWGIGATVGLLILRDWPHVLWVAVLVPLWLCAEWEAAEFVVPWFRGGHALPAVGLFVLGAAYLASVGDGRDATWRCWSRQPFCPSSIRVRRSCRPHSRRSGPSRRRSPGSCWAGAWRSFCRCSPAGCSGESQRGR